MSLRDLAKRTGFTNGYASQVETGARGVGAAYLLAACAVLGLDPAEVLCAFRVVPERAAAAFFDVDRMRAALAGEQK